MKKAIKIIVAVALIVMLCVPTFASDNHDIKDLSNIEVFPPDGYVATDVEIQNIINHLIGNENTITPFSIMCTLFGHDYTVEFWTLVQHKYFDTSPRCLTTYYDISICSRCDQIKSTWVSDARLPCCP